ncbi:MAG: peptide chain release factor 3 [Gemmatimonadota bacterium]
MSSTALAREIRRRRTFAIISHPDAGKTTLTEKLLLYGGAIQQAGSIRARKAARHARSDWLEMEKARGISITASVLHFDYQGFRINLLDTPGHQDFSEDTYRALTAADSAIMLLDNRKGVEAQTRKLFSVCRRRRLPIFTFVNKCDREGEDPLQIIDDTQSDLGIRAFAAAWPIRVGGRLVGVYDRLGEQAVFYQKTEDHGQSVPPATRVDITDEFVEETLGAEAAGRLREEIELLEVAGERASREEVASGEATPVFFGSALTNYGVDVLLERFLESAPPPGARESSAGAVDPVERPFSGFVFKVQANMDLRHRDRIAFLRVCSGRFEPGAEAVVSRTGKTIRLAQPQEFMAGERSHTEDAVAGDVVGLHDRGSLRVGDTVALGESVEYPGVPRFSPEHFSQVRLDDPLRRKHLDRGLHHLAEEGTILLLFAESITGPIPIVGAVGRLQFDVLVDRLAREYSVQIGLDPLPFQLARWVVGPMADMKTVGRKHGRRLVEDVDGHPMMMFDNEWTFGRTAEEESETLEFHDVQPRRG